MSPNRPRFVLSHQHPHTAYGQGERKGEREIEERGGMREHAGVKEDGSRESEKESTAVPSN